MLSYSGVVRYLAMPLSILTEKAMKDDMGRVEYASLLYDFYGALLSDPQREVMELYHEDNLSLAEIADETGTSRQAVHYTLKKAEKTLEEFEAKLGLIEQYRAKQKQKERLAQLMAQDSMSLADRAEALTLIEVLAE